MHKRQLPTVGCLLGLQVQEKGSSSVLVCAGVSSVLATSSCSSQTIATKDIEHFPALGNVLMPFGKADFGTIF